MKVKVNMKIIWGVMLILGSINIVVQFYRYKEHGYISEYAFKNYFDEKEENIRDSHHLVIKILKDYSLKKENYELVDLILKDFMTNLSEEYTISKLRLMIGKKAKREDVLPILNDFKIFQKKVLNRQVFSERFERKMNRGEKRRAKDRLKLEELLQLKNNKKEL